MLLYVTSNKNKFDVANKFLTRHHIPLKAVVLELTEIQSESVEEIARKKATEAFSILKKPLIVSDHFWSITALNGFPGAYMKYVNQWFVPEDFLALMRAKSNREVTLTEGVVFTDGNITKYFSVTHTGVVLERKEGQGLPALTIISLTKDGISIAKNREKDPSVFKEHKLWEEFAQWYKTSYMTSA